MPCKTSWCKVTSKSHGLVPSLLALYTSKHYARQFSTVPAPECASSSQRQLIFSLLRNDSCWTVNTRRPASMSMEHHDPNELASHDSLSPLVRQPEGNPIDGLTNSRGCNVCKSAPKYIIVPPPLRRPAGGGARAPRRQRE